MRRQLRPVVAHFRRNYNSMRNLRRLALATILVPLLVRAADYGNEAKDLAKLMDWKPGEVIAEIGAGEGQMSFFAANLVGQGGLVYTTELNDDKLANLKKEVARKGLTNVKVVKGDLVGTNLPDSCCQSIFMRRVYHHFTDPGRMDDALFRALNPGGLLAIIDFPPTIGLPPLAGVPRNRGGHGIPKNILIQELKSAGFIIVSQPKDWPNQGDYCVIARRPPLPK